jgi:hypothetical protein
VPWYFDCGAGDSRYTWQVMAGAGYRFGWGDVSVAYRHLDYKFGATNRSRSSRSAGRWRA